MSVGHRVGLFDAMAGPRDYLGQRAWQEAQRARCGGAVTRLVVDAMNALGGH